MTNDDIRDALRSRPIRKLTGPPEHWLTTLVSGFWGLTEDWEGQWKALTPGDVCLFHSTDVAWAPLMRPKPRLTKGVIGFGVVKGVRRKSEPVWIQEIEQGKVWPLLVDFSETRWFGKIEGIEMVPVAQKLGRPGQIRDEVERLQHGCIPFSEFTRRGCSFPAQPSIAGFTPEKAPKAASFVGEYLGRSSAVANALSTPPGDGQAPQRGEARPGQEPGEQPNFVGGVPTTQASRSIPPAGAGNSAGELGPTDRKVVQLLLDLEKLERASARHREVVGVVASFLRARGLKPKESRIDAYAISGSQAFVFEVKTIHEGNYRAQTRAGIGQLLEYLYFDLPRVGMGAPSLVHDGIEVFWAAGGELRGDPSSMRTLRAFSESNRAAPSRQHPNRSG